MAEQRHSRRRFLKYAGVGIVATAAGAGYLTKNYWYPLTQSTISKPTETISPVTNEPPVLNSSPPPTSRELPTNPPATLSPPKSPMSEDEKMVRELLEKDWVAAFNSNNLDRMLSLYTEDVTLFAEPSFSYRGLRGDHSLSWHYNYNFSHHWGIIYYKIVTVNISDNKAEALSYLTVDKGAETQMGLSEYSRYKLRKITEITKGRTTTKLPKPIWRIYDEYEVWIY
jgi:hypothetical protein